MKKLIAVLVLVICTTVYAVTTITYNVPDDYGKELLAALIAQSDCHVSIEIRGHNPDPEQEYNARIDFRTPAYVEGENPALFVKRRIALFATALKCAHEQKLKDDILRDYYQNAPVVDVNTPDPNDLG